MPSTEAAFYISFVMFFYLIEVGVTLPLNYVERLHTYTIIDCADLEQRYHCVHVNDWCG